jgi:hypothetical protein
MLYEFIDMNRDVIISRTRDRVRSRPWPSVAPGEVEHGVPLFLAQLIGDASVGRTNGQSSLTVFMPHPSAFRHAPGPTSK